MNPAYLPPKEYTAFKRRVNIFWATVTLITLFICADAGIDTSIILFLLMTPVGVWIWIICKVSGDRWRANRALGDAFEEARYKELYRIQEENKREEEREREEDYEHWSGESVGLPPAPPVRSESELREIAARMAATESKRRALIAAEKARYPHLHPKSKSEQP